MATRAATIAESLKDVLNAAGPFSPPFTAERAYLPTFDVKDLADVKVRVATKAQAEERQHRSGWLHVIAVDVAVQQRIDPQSLDEGDELSELVETIKTRIKDHGPLDSGAVLMGVETDPLHRPDHLQEHSVFTSVMTFTYRLAADY